MQPKFNDYEEGYGSELLCPRCDGQFTHHDQVEVFERDEDADSGTHVRVAEGQAVVDSSLDGNPSSRRHGLCIRFWCELCGGRSILTVSQHKGVTLVDFVDTGDTIDLEGGEQP